MYLIVQPNEYIEIYEVVFFKFVDKAIRLMHYYYTKRSIYSLYIQELALLSLSVFYQQTTFG